MAEMGIRVHLAVIADRISEDEWRGIYARARRVVQQWIPRPLALAWRQVGGVRVGQYGFEIERPDGLHVVGDAETLATAESFVFPASLERVRRVREGACAGGEDVLVAVAGWLGSGTEWRVSWCDLFGEQTRGLPYHTLIVALGLLVEHALPGAAVVYGDISVRGGEQARRGLAAILREEIEPPVVVDAGRLRRRLAANLRGDALERAVHQLGPLNPHVEAMASDLLGMLRRLPDARVRHELEYVVRVCPDPDGLAPETRELVRELVRGIHASVVRWELRERVGQWGAARTREEIARRTLSSGMCLTGVAWDAIEVADLDELAFVYVAVCMDTTRLEVHQAVRAVIENRALRWA